LLPGVGSIDVASEHVAVVAAAMANGIGSLGPVVQEILIGYMKVGSAEDGLGPILALLVGVSAIGVVLTAVLLVWKRQGKCTL
jgi:hypothetical protein